MKVVCRNTTLRDFVALTLLFYFPVLIARGWRPRSIVVVDRRERVLGGVLLTRNGTLVRAALVDVRDPRRGQVLRLLVREVDRLLSRREYEFRFWTGNAAIMLAGTRRGFAPTGRTRSVHTLTWVGPFRLSWLRNASSERIAARRSGNAILHEMKRPGIGAGWRT